MSIVERDLHVIAQTCYETSYRHGFWPMGGNRRNLPEALMLIVSEASEALEDLRDGKLPEEIWYSDGKPEGFPIELADILIRTLDLMVGIGVQPAEVLAIKMRYNLNRPFKHGKTL